MLDVALRLGRLLETRHGRRRHLHSRRRHLHSPGDPDRHRQSAPGRPVHLHPRQLQQRPTARGVETYYLNFTSNADALEVAARENAVSQKSIFELQDLVKKITLKDKIDESRELATDVQQSLYTGLSQALHAEAIVA